MKSKGYQMRDNVYRCSSATYFYRYVLTSLFGGGFLLALILIWNLQGHFLYEELKGAIVTVFWALIWFTILMIRLRNVEANREGLVIKTFKGQQIIDYKDVDWIFQTVFIRPVLISMKYRDRETGKSRKILLMPEVGSQNFGLNFSDETEMAGFIRERVMDSNPNYSKAIEPSRWHPIGLMLLTGLFAILFFT
jgi:hypothetical protein